MVHILLCWLGLVQLLVLDVQGYGSYRAAIPNGDRVPHPCKDNYLWQGVGHTTKDGGGSRNKFGEDFAAANREWTSELCLKDSDGDGQTNGYELGDPDCIWTRNDVDPSSGHLSHPGVCEPWNDPKCLDQSPWISAACQPDEFNCAATKEVGVKKMTLRFPPTQVPAQETSYMCMEFNLDTSDDFHMVATQAIINNTNVMHHAVIFGCESVNHTLRDTPQQCGMVASRECATILSIWVLGSPGECFHDQIGFRVGNSGYKRVALQFHWNNPTMTDQYIDSSGMILHYTNQKRQNDAGVLTIGADYLEIYGRTEKTVQSAICPGSCSSRFITDKVYIVSAFNHMHYLGVSQKIELFRNGVKLRDITNDKYNYDSPVVYDFAEPIEVLPGDTLTTTCTYNSKNRETVTYFGDATSAEMCFGFMTYYPKANIERNFCTSWKGVPHCSVYNPDIIDGCDVYGYVRTPSVIMEVFSRINASCYSSCTAECARLINSDPCFKGKVRDYIYGNSWQYRADTNELIRLSSQCDGVVDITTTVADVTTTVADVTTTVADVTTTVADVTTKVADVTTKVADVTTKVADVTTTVNDVTTKVADVTTKVNDVTTQVNDVTTKASDVTTKASASDVTTNATTKASASDVTTKASDVTTIGDPLNGATKTQFHLTYFFLINIFLLLTFTSQC